MKEILKCIVGSQAHELAGPDSDFDYRGVFIVPTSEILKLGGSVKHTSWIEGKEDDTSWEIGHFLNLAAHCNPTILEVFLAPTMKESFVKNPSQEIIKLNITPEGEELRELFPKVWNSQGVRDAFIGYGLNQRKKFLEEKDGRPAKFAVAYLRTLYQAYHLLTTGTFPISMKGTEIYETLKEWKTGKYEIGDVIQKCHGWQKLVELAFEKNPDKQTDVDAVNRFLLKIRKENW